MNIYQKLIDVRKECGYLEKANAGHQFKYVSSSQTLAALRGKMDELGLLLIPRVISHEVRRHENNKKKHDDCEKRQYFTILDMTFTWVNADEPTETIECQWTGQGLDDSEKGVGKALTYAEKFFMLKFFNIATDKDDPDSFQKKNESQSSRETKQREENMKRQADGFSMVEDGLRKQETLDGVVGCWEYYQPTITSLNANMQQQLTQLKDARIAEFEAAQ